MLKQGTMNLMNEREARELAEEKLVLKKKLKIL